MSPIQNVTYKKCYLYKKLPIRNVTYTNCYLYQMLLYENVLDKMLLNENVLDKMLLNENVLNKTLLIQQRPLDANETFKFVVDAFDSMPRANYISTLAHDRQKLDQ